MATTIASITFDLIRSEGPLPRPQPRVSREDGVGGSVAVILPAVPARWTLRAYKRQDDMASSGLEAHVGTVVAIASTIYTGNALLVEAVDESITGLWYEGAQKQLLTARATIEIWP
jgi:hypothetical protein